MVAIGEVAACGFVGSPLGTMNSVDCVSVAIVVATTVGVTPNVGVLAIGIVGKELKLIQNEKPARLLQS